MSSSNKENLSYTSSNRFFPPVSLARIGSFVQRGKCHYCDWGGQLGSISLAGSSLKHPLDLLQTWVNKRQGTPEKEEIIERKRFMKIWEDI